MIPKVCKVSFNWNSNLNSPTSHEWVPQYLVPWKWNWIGIIEKHFPNHYLNSWFLFGVPEWTSWELNETFHLNLKLISCFAWCLMTLKYHALKIVLDNGIWWMIWILNEPFLDNFHLFNTWIHMMKTPSILNESFFQNNLEFNHVTQT